MAFILSQFNNTSSGAADSAKAWAYRNLSDTVSTMAAAGYFDQVKFSVNFGDSIYVVGSDGSQQLVVSSQNGDTVTVTFGIAPFNATYITQTPSAQLSGEQALSLLSTGILKSATGTGVVSIATAGTDYQQALSGLALTAVTAATNDKVLIQDTSDFSNLKTTTVQSILDLAGGGGLSIVDVSGTSATAAANTLYVISNAAQTTITLPGTCAIGDIVGIIGTGAAGWILDAPAGDVVNIGALATSSGGTVTSASRYDCVEVMCTVANSSWVMRSSITAGFTVA